jgi:hypothetical protein
MKKKKEGEAVLNGGGQGGKEKAAEELEKINKGI